MREPVEIVAIALPIVLEAVVVTMFIAMCAVWIVIASAPVPA